MAVSKTYTMHPLFCSSSKNMNTKNIPMPIHGLALVLLISSLACPTTSCTEQEQTCLLQFLARLSHDGGLAASWRNGTDCCTWEGITCSSMDDTVLAVSLAGRRLEGHISPSLGSLASLSRLNLSHNSLSGDVPPELVSSNSIVLLNVSFNLLKGNLLQQRLSSSAPGRHMQVIDISSNAFTGRLSPATWGNMDDLAVLNASNNSFTGSLPSFLCRSMSSLSVLDLSFNKFSGNVPPELGKCSMLRSLKISHNNLTGTISDELFNVTSLRQLSFPNNRLHGALDPALIIKLSNLAVLDLGWNMISGNIPDSIGQLKGLKELILDNNYMSGELPSALGNCTNLVTINFKNNSFSGELGKINFSTLYNLKTLDVGWNNFSGTIPESVYYSCSKLTVLKLSFNKFHGQLSPRMRNLKSLTVLSLAGNYFTNARSAIEILKSFGNLTTLLIGSNFKNEQIPGDETVDGFENLKVLAMENCQLFGNIPLWISNLRNLEMLLLCMNELSGSIPVWIGTLNFLFYIDLSYNSLTGEIPAGLMEISMLKSDRITTHLDPKGFDLPTYNYDGHSPRYYTIGAFLAMISLGHNNLTGVIPSEIGQLKALVSLILGFNSLSGQIPRTISNLTNLEVLDLSNNHLTGTIPGALNNLNFLSRFNISNNDLEGSVPHGGQFDTFPSSSFDGNPKLCASVLTYRCDSIEAPKGSTEQGYKVMFIIAFVAFFGLGVLLDQLYVSRLFG